ncbi:agenet domain-containing protein [Tanacetum coccineum]
MILSEKRQVIETLKHSDKHKKLLDSVLLYKTKLDRELELEEEEAMEAMVKSYKAIKEKNDPRVFVLLIRLETKFDFHALADTGSNINVMPYRIYKKLRREQVKPVSHKITMLDHSKAEPMGILKDVLCQVGVTTILASFLIIDIPIDRDVPIVIGRSFLYTCRSILNIIKGTTSTFDGVCHQKFYDAKEALNPFKTICVWKKPIDFLGSLPVPLQHAEWIPNRSRNFAKEAGYGKWHTKIRVVDPCGNIFEQGYETKPTDRKISEYYKLSDIMSPKLWYGTPGPDDSVGTAGRPRGTTQVVKRSYLMIVCQVAWCNRYEVPMIGSGSKPIIGLAEEMFQKVTCQAMISGSKNSGSWQ